MVTHEVIPDPQKVDASAATVWLTDGWRLFVAAPGVWMAIAVVMIVIYMLLSFIPGIGQVATSLLAPVFTAGLLQCSRTADAGSGVAVEQMFAGFRHNTSNLVITGLIALAGFALISVIAFAIVGVAGGVSLFHAIRNEAYSSVQIGTALVALLVATLIWLLLALPLTMAMWFAPALVYFNNVTPVNAMKSSFRACKQNWLPISIYGLVLMVLMFVATIPFGLGWLVLIPVMTASIYFSYRDIYGLTAA